MSDNTIELDGAVVGGSFGDRYMVLPSDVDRGKYRVTLTRIEPELLDCPFCGHGAVLKQYERTFELGTWHYLVECSACTVAGEYMPTRADAIAAWNRRA